MCTHTQGGAEAMGMGLLFPSFAAACQWAVAMLTAFSLMLTVKKKSSPGLKLSNLMNLGRKKSTSLEPPDRSLETSSKHRSHLQALRAHPPGQSPSPGRRLGPRRQGLGSRPDHLLGGQSRGSRFLDLRCRWFSCLLRCWSLCARVLPVVFKKFCSFDEH